MESDDLAIARMEAAEAAGRLRDASRSAGRGIIYAGALVAINAALLAFSSERWTPAWGLNLFGLALGVALLGSWCYQWGQLRAVTAIAGPMLAAAADGPAGGSRLDTDD